MTDLIDDKPKYKHDVDALVAKAKWRILCFDKNGASYEGNSLYNTKELCESKIIQLEASLKPNTRHGYRGRCGRYFFDENYSYSMPMPVLI